MAEKKTWMVGKKFDEVMPHHAGIKALWSTKWKMPVSQAISSIYNISKQDQLNEID